MQYYRSMKFKIFFFTVPSHVENLGYQIMDSTTVCVKWKPPQQQNEKVVKYILSYTPNQTWPLENWYNFEIDAMHKSNQVRL